MSEWPDASGAQPIEHYPYLTADPGLTYRQAAEACIHRLAGTAGADYLEVLLETAGTEQFHPELLAFLRAGLHQRFSTGERVVFDMAVTFATAGGAVTQVGDLFKPDRPTREFLADLIARVGL